MIVWSIFWSLVHCLGEEAVARDNGTVVYIISFPKSGRTWLRLMIANAYDSALRLNVSERALIDWQPLRARARAKLGVELPNFKVDHTRLALDYRSADKWTLPPYLHNQNVIFLVRDPRDVLVSDWFEKKVKGLKLYRSKYEYSETPFCKGGNGSCSCFDDAYTLSEFMREPDGGFQTICDFISFYLRHQDRYEDMKRNAVEQLERVLTFVSESPSTNEPIVVPRSAVVEAVEKCAFDRMRQVEMGGRYGPRLSARDLSNPDTFKTREGVVGGFRKHFDAATQEWLLETMKVVLDDSLGYNTL